MSMFQSPLPPTPACTPQFTTNNPNLELRNAVNNYISQGCGSSNPNCSTIQTYGYINNWCTTGITDMSYLFYDKTTFNQDIGGWDTSLVTKFSHMFWGASSFNQYIGDWNTSSALDMTAMFLNCLSFNQYIGGWDTSSVFSFDRMFYGTKAFNQDITGWDTSSATTTSQMFQLASVFNQDISGWDISSVTDFGQMFYGTAAFNQNLCAWKDAIIENDASTRIMFRNSPGGQPNANDGTDRFDTSCTTPSPSPTSSPTSSYIVEAPCKSLYEVSSLFTVAYICILVTFILLTIVDDTR